MWGKCDEENGQNFGVVLVLTIVGLAIYSNALHGEFISDDYLTVVDNQSIRHIQAIGEIWKDFNTRFLVGLSFAVNFCLGQLNVFGYHLFNILLHIAVSFLVYRFVRLTFATPRMRNDVLQPHARRWSFYAALIFLCHPIQTEGVAYITQRAVAMATFFYLLTLILYIRGRLQQKWIYSVGAWLAMLVGIFTKEMIVTLPFTILIYENFFLRDEKYSWRNSLKRLVPFFILSGVIFYVFLKDQPGSVLNLKRQIAAQTFNWNYFFTEINVLRTYLRLLVFPVKQNLDYDYPIAMNVREPGTLFSLFLLLGLLVFAFQQRARRRLLSFAVIWFFITTSVEVMVVSIVKRGVIYEHWLYLPMVGFAIFLCAALGYFFENENSFKRIMVGIIIVFSLLTFQRNRIWQNEIVFWEDVVEKSPQKASAYLGAGIAYQRKELLPQAVLSYRKAVDLYEQEGNDLSVNDKVYYSRVCNNLALTLYLLNQKSEAWETIQKSLNVFPFNVEAWNNMGVIAYHLGKYEEAISAFQRSVELQGKYPKAEDYIKASTKALQDRK